VFDLDETLGYFTELGMFWDCLKQYLKQENSKTILTQTDFNDILDLFPEFLRPNIINILTYLKKRKESKCCHKMMIYTNNNGSPEWAHHIISYFESKIKYKLIDQLIAAFKINGKQVEICRTTYNKTHNDLIRCTKIPASAEICFLDDVEHPKMVDERVYYIKLQPYYSHIPFDLFVVRFLNSALYRDVFDKLHAPSILNDATTKSVAKKEMIDLFVKYANMAKYDIKENHRKLNPREIDEIISKYILYHLQQFFQNGPPQPIHPLRSLSNKKRGVKTSKKNGSARSASPKPATGYIFQVDKHTAVKNMRNKTMRNR